MAVTRAETPEVTWTTVPPAKSSEGMCPPFAFSKSANSPHHVRHRAVDNQRPEREKHGHRAELHAFGKCAGDQSRRDDGEHELVDHVGLLRNCGRVVGIGRQAHAAQENVLESANKAGAVRKGERVSHDCPEDRDQAHHGEALHHGAENVLAAHQSAVEQGQAGSGHQQHQRRRDQHPGIVGIHLGSVNRVLEGLQIA